jgi:sugar phosphate isomerase/epimerase
MYTSLNARALGLPIPAEATIDLAARHGFGGVDLLVRDLVDSGADLASLRARMDDLGLRAGAFPLPVDWRGTEARFAHDLARLPRLADAAAALGLRRTATWVMPAVPDDLGRQVDPARRQAAAVTFHVTRLGAIARALEPAGVRLGLEVIGVASARTGRGEPFVYRLADLDRVLGDVWLEASNLGVLVDGFHLYAAGEPVEVALSWGVERVVWVHVADLPRSAPLDRLAIDDHDRGLPGEHPAVPTAELLRHLAAAGYDGPVTPEPMPGCRSLAGLTPGQAVRRAAEALHSVWPDGPPPGSMPAHR